MELAIVAGEISRAIASCEGIDHCDAKVFLTGAEIFRPDSRATGPLGRGHDKAVVEVQTVRAVGLSCPTDDLHIRQNKFYRFESVENLCQLFGVGWSRELVKQSGCKFR